MEVILDTNFIIACVKRKIDFVQELSVLGFTPVIAREVIEELKDLRLKVSHADRSAIELALTLFASQKKLKKTRLGKGIVDEGLIAKGRQGIHIATLDAAIKRAVPNRIVISNAQNALMIERD